MGLQIWQLGCLIDIGTSFVEISTELSDFVTLTVSHNILLDILGDAPILLIYQRGPLQLFKECGAR